MANDNPTSSDQVIPAAGNPAPYLQNRELSWLDFNERVLEQGADAHHEEFLQVAPKDGDEVQTLQKRDRLVGTLFEYALVEVEP